MECIKCGKTIPEGELFCIECSLNPTELEFDEPQTVRYPAAEGRMQTPKVRQAPKPAAKAAPAPKAKVGGGLKVSFAAVLVMLVLAVGFAVWQYMDIQVERNRLRVREADMDSLQWELEDLRDQASQLELELQAAEQTIAAKELALQEVEDALSGSQSSMSQTQYDMAAQKLELERIKSEKATVEADLLKVQGRLTTVEKRLEEARVYQEKAEFMDDHVVFVEDNRTGYYHTYSCEDFPKQKFWAYSRKLAEANSFKPCPNCGGRP